MYDSSNSANKSGACRNNKRSSHIIASSRAESILISSSGDVIVCRCRESPYPLRGSSTYDGNGLDNNNDTYNNHYNNDRNDGGRRTSSSLLTTTMKGWNGYLWMMKDAAYVCCDGDADLSIASGGGGGAGRVQTQNALSSAEVGRYDMFSNGTFQKHRLNDTHQQEAPHPQDPPRRQEGLLGGAQPALVTPVGPNSECNGGLLAKGKDGNHLTKLNRSCTIQCDTDKHNNRINKNNSDNNHDCRNDDNDNEGVVKVVLAVDTKHEYQHASHLQKDLEEPPTPTVLAPQLSPRSDDIDRFGYDLESIMPLPSFDHTHFYEDSGSPVTQLFVPHQKRPRSKGHSQKEEKHVTPSTEHNKQTGRRRHRVKIPNPFSSSTNNNKSSTIELRAKEHERQLHELDAVVAYATSAAACTAARTTTRQQQQRQQQYPLQNQNQQIHQQPRHPHHHQQQHHQRQHTQRTQLFPQPHTPEFVHGVPTFLNLFSNVKITTVSAHPLGAHVLLISDAGLLFSYGNNDYGQLGIGFQSRKATSPSSNIENNATQTSSPHSIHSMSTYVMTPTIITPIVENGGKAIACAAGVSHSLVVVETEEQRLVKKKTSSSVSSRSYENDTSIDSDTFTLGNCVNNRQQQSPYGPKSSSSTVTVLHHQVYGFGRNDYLKIGLVSPKLSAVVACSTNTPSVSVPLSAQAHTDNIAIGNQNKQLNTYQVSRAVAEVDEMEVVVLPRRVALRCTVHPNRSRNTSNLSPLLPSGNNNCKNNSNNSQHDDSENSNHIYDKISNIQKPVNSTTCNLSNEMCNNHHPEQYGIFAIEASVDHSAALVRRPSGDVELLTWGNAMYYALGLPIPTSVHDHQEQSSQAHEPCGRSDGASLTSDKKNTATSIRHQQPSIRIVPVPSLVSSLSRLSLNHGNVDGMQTLSMLRGTEYPSSIALGPKCTFVVTSFGRCFSFGISDDGMLGHGHNITEIKLPTELTTLLPSSCHDCCDTIACTATPLEQQRQQQQHKQSINPQQKCEPICSISAGASHVVAVTQKGEVYGWGSKSHLGLLPFHENNNITMKVHGLQANKQQLPKNQEISSGEESYQGNDMQLVQWTPVLIDVFDPARHNKTSSNLKENVAVSKSSNFETNIKDNMNSNIKEFTRKNCSPVTSNESVRNPCNVNSVVHARAGYDCTYFVSDDGRVYSCGKKSGRLGHGDFWDDFSDHGHHATYRKNDYYMNISGVPVASKTAIISDSKFYNGASSCCDPSQNLTSTPIKPLFGGLRLFWKKTTKSTNAILEPAVRSTNAKKITNIGNKTTFYISYKKKCI